jgi:hypothetical protein
MMMAGALGRGAYLGGKYKRAIKNQTEAMPISNEARSVTVDGKTYATSDKVNIPKGSLLGKVYKTDAEKAKHLTDLKAEFSAKLTGDANEKKAIVDEIFKEGVPKKILNNLKEAQKGQVKLRSDVNDRFDDPARSLEEYALAKKIMERGITSPGK